MMKRSGTVTPIPLRKTDPCSPQRSQGVEKHTQPAVQTGIARIGLRETFELACVGIGLNAVEDKDDAYPAR